MKDNDTHVVIMAGGVGSRLWPISTPERPKQFIDVLGVGKSLIQMTAERFLPSAPIENFWVVTSAEYSDIVHEQLPGIPPLRASRMHAGRLRCITLTRMSW